MLPKDIEETYKRLLCKASNADDLRSFLHWVALSARPITVEELSQVITIDLQSREPCYDADLRYMHPRDALSVCSGFVIVFEGTVKMPNL